ncbi:hypothetical protein BDN72DRAFT_207929 [Pluteus cervinus]|uniref:Uncharacterized protein n=1 Tax=Pluteus cervinus TaxID=181527 RepID=A0ACD3AHR8_9AGAR|nr:hypothetical protein BDN72DRAFT_207929 [Pluteus cervinus]
MRIRGRRPSALQLQLWRETWRVRAPTLVSTWTQKRKVLHTVGCAVSVTAWSQSRFLSTFSSSISNTMRSSKGLQFLSLSNPSPLPYS